ncbi:hypothetical protein AKJ16_DCAP02951, partial [Drosera capensis]
MNREPGAWGGFQARSGGTGGVGNRLSLDGKTPTKLGAAREGPGKSSTPDVVVEFWPDLVVDSIVGGWRGLGVTRSVSAVEVRERGREFPEAWTVGVGWKRSGRDDFQRLRAVSGETQTSCSKTQALITTLDSQPQEPSSCLKCLENVNMIPELHSVLLVVNAQVKEEENK